MVSVCQPIEGFEYNASCGQSKLWSNCGQPLWSIFFLKKLFFSIFGHFCSFFMEKKLNIQKIFQCAECFIHFLADNTRKCLKSINNVLKILTSDLVGNGVPMKSVLLYICTDTHTFFLSFISFWKNVPICHTNGTP